MLIPVRDQFEQRISKHNMIDFQDVFRVGPDIIGTGADDFLEIQIVLKRLRDMIDVEVKT